MAGLGDGYGDGWTSAVETPRQIGKQRPYYERSDTKRGCQFVQTFAALNLLGEGGFPTSRQASILGTVSEILDQLYKKSIVSYDRITYVTWDLGTCARGSYELLLIISAGHSSA